MNMWIKSNAKKIVAIIVVIALMFIIWKDPINIKASGQDMLEVPEKTTSYTIDLDDGSYMEYVINDEVVTCNYYEYIGTDEDGQAMYNIKTSTVDILSENDEVDDNDYIKRGGPLYWKKVVKDKFKREYFYQTGVKDDEMFYRIGSQYNYVINYSKIENKVYVDQYIELLDSVNKQMLQCLAVAIGSVLVAIAAIVASYISAGASMCLKAISSILNKCGVTLMSISPVGFGHMVFEMYEDFVELEKKFAMAATYGIIEQ